MAHILYIQLMTVTHSSKPLDTQNPNHQNSSVLYIWLKEHIHSSVDRLNSEFRDTHDMALNKIFTVHNEKDFMINYRVENLVELLAELRKEGVTIVGDIQEFEYGKFGWILDNEKNKIELWEPKDEAFK